MPIAPLPHCPIGHVYLHLCFFSAHLHSMANFVTFVCMHFSYNQTKTLLQENHKAEYHKLSVWRYFTKARVHPAFNPQEYLFNSLMMISLFYVYLDESHVL